MLLARLLDSTSIFLQFPLQFALLLDPPASLSLHTPASCHYLPLPMSLLRVLSKLSRHINPRPSYRPLLPLFDLLTKLFTPPWSATSYTRRSSHIRQLFFTLTSLTFRYCPSITLTFPFLFYTCPPPHRCFLSLTPVFTPLTPSFLPSHTQLFTTITPAYIRHLPHYYQTYPPPPPLAVTYPGLECELCVVVELGPRGGDQCWNLLTEISHTLVGEKFLSKQTNTTDPDIYRHDVSVFDVFIASYDVTVLPDPSECKHLLLWQPPRKRKPPLIRYTEKKIKERK